MPPARRRLHPHLLRLRLVLGTADTIEATAWIGDGRFPVFSVGFTVSRHGDRWLVSSFAGPD